MVLPLLDVISAYEGLFSGSLVFAFGVDFSDWIGTGQDFCIYCDPWGPKLTVEFGGLPRLGGKATSTSPSVTAGFSRSIDTMSVRVPSWSLKDLGPLSRTLNGPSYGACNEAHLPSRRT